VVQGGLNASGSGSVDLIMRLAPLGLLALTLIACEAGSGAGAPVGPPPASPEPAPAPSPAPEPPASPAARAVDAGSCPVVVTVTIAASGTKRELIASAENRQDTPQEVVLPDRCPGGAVSFTGLPGGYDFYGTCNMGKCPGNRPAARFGLGIGERRELGRTTIDLGGSTCNTAVAPGKYVVSASIPGVAPACVTGAPLIVAAPTTRPPPPKTPAPEPTPTPNPDPRPAASPGGAVDFHACTADSDCIVHCPRADGCCGWPCGCQNAINKAHKKAYDAHHARTCRKAPDCPAMGCAYEPHHSARCVNKRCRSSAGIGF
jgi:hypothetical protein